MRLVRLEGIPRTSWHRWIRGRMVMSGRWFTRSSDDGSCASDPGPGSYPRYGTTASTTYYCSIAGGMFWLSRKRFVGS